MSWAGYIPGSLLREDDGEEGVTQPLDGLAVMNALIDHNDWEGWLYWASKNTMPSKTKVLPVKGIGEVEVVSSTTGVPEGSDEYSRQGSTYAAHIVFKVGDQFFRKEGTADSYGEVTWDGKFLPVKATEKTVVVYEFEES